MSLNCDELPQLMKEANASSDMKLGTAQALAGIVNDASTSASTLAAGSRVRTLTTFFKTNMASLLIKPFGGT